MDEQEYDQRVEYEEEDDKQDTKKTTMMKRK